MRILPEVRLVHVKDIPVGESFILYTGSGGHAHMRVAVPEAFMKSEREVWIVDLKTGGVSLMGPERMVAPLGGHFYYVEPLSTLGG